MIETAYLLAGIIVGGGAGIVFGKLTSDATGWQRRFIKAEFRRMDLEAAERRRQAQRVAAASKGRAAQEAKRAEARRIRMEAAEQRLAMAEAAE